MNNYQAAASSFSDGEISAKNKNTKGHVEKRNFCSYEKEKGSVKKRVSEFMGTLQPH
jgi:hypothetical protein